MAAFTELLTKLSLFLAAVTTVAYLYQVVYLFVPFFKKSRPHGPAKQNRYCVLIAARNEEAVIGHLIDSINDQDYPSELVTVYVVADNCTDRTAEIAAAHGARVYQRFNKVSVGKGYALEFLLDRIRREGGGWRRFDDYLIFDADNLLEPDYISQMNRVASDGYDAFCGYRNTKNFGDSWLSSGCGLWYLHDSTHLNRSRMLLGSCCAVNGTGFGFTRELLERLNGWHFHTLTEDIEFSTWCATHGIRIGYCHDAVLYDEQVTGLRQSWRQRTRWTQGGIQIVPKYSRDLLRGICTGGRTSYASFETATLSMWGYGLGALTTMCTLILTFLAERWMGIAMALMMALVSTYLSMFAIGALTMLTEHKRIRGTTGQKIKALFTFPVFMFTFIPIAITAFFRKPQWKPIAHTTAISVRDLR